MKKYNLIESIKNQSSDAQILYENIKTAPFNTVELLEAADKYIEKLIVALKSGKNPFEIIPGSDQVLAGLILLRTDVNREALNMPEKNFSIIAQKLSTSDRVKKFVAKQAKNSGKLVANLKAMAADPDHRVRLGRKLYSLQQLYSQVKHKAKRDQEFRSVA